jgi:hypothetical protein
MLDPRTVCCLYYTLKVHKKFLANNKFTKEAILSLQIPHGIQNFQNKKKKTVSKLRNWDKLCTLIFDEMSITLHVGYDINEFHGFEMDSPELKIAEHVSIINKIINISIFRFPKGINTILSDKVR